MLAIGAPQIVWIVLAAMGLAITIVKHGEPRDPFSMWSGLINITITTGLLYWGGFFTN